MRGKKPSRIHASLQHHASVATIDAPRTPDHPMRTTITVERQRSYPISHLVAADAVKLLESMTGVSEVAVDSETDFRATISYRWKDPGILTPGISAALMAQGMRLV